MFYNFPWPYLSENPKRKSQLQLIIKAVCYFFTPIHMKIIFYIKIFLDRITSNFLLLCHVKAAVKTL